MMSVNYRQDTYCNLSDAWCQIKGWKDEVFLHLGGMCEKELERKKTESGNLPIVRRAHNWYTGMYV